MPSLKSAAHQRNNRNAYSCPKSAMALSLNTLPATRAPPPSTGPSPAPWPVWGMGNNQAIQHSLLTKILDSLKGNPPRFTTFRTSTVVDKPSPLNRFQNSFGRGRFFDYDFCGYLAGQRVSGSRDVSLSPLRFVAAPGPYFNR